MRVNQFLLTSDPAQSTAATQSLNKLVEGAKAIDKEIAEMEEFDATFKDPDRRNALKAAITESTALLQGLARVSEGVARSRSLYEKEMKAVAADFSSRIMNLNRTLAERREGLQQTTSAAQRRNESLVLGLSLVGIIFGEFLARRDGQHDQTHGRTHRERPPDGRRHPQGRRPRFRRHEGDEGGDGLHQIRRR
jgi:hypothetical protein